MANIFSVSNADELMTALASAKGGDTIELAGGDYGDLVLRGDVANFSFDSTVTIVSADPDNQAVISKLFLRETSNLKFDNLIFDYEFSDGDHGWHRPFYVRDSDNITFSNSSFLGDVAQGVSEIYDGYGTAYGLNITRSDNIVIENNNFETWGKGLILNEITDLKVSGNEISLIREDGMNLIQVVNAYIENNYLHDNRTHPEDTGHRDMIQLWVLPTHDAPSSNVNITGNILDIGDGPRTQAIFMRNGAAEQNPEDTSMYWQDVTIENNTIYNSHTHGITVGETVNLTVQNNSLIQVDQAWGDGGANMSPKIHIAKNSETVLVSQNIAAAITGYEGQEDWKLASNAIVSKEDYITNFVTSSMVPQDGAHGFRVLPDSKADQINAGSEQTRYPESSDALAALFQVHSDASSSHSLILDASLTVGPLGLVSEEDTEFLWTFEDGSTATGRVIKHTFEEPGYQDVTLTVVAGDGTTAQAGFTAGISGDRLVHFDAQSGQFEALAFGEEKPLDSIEGSVVNTSEGHVLKLGGDGIKASIPRSELTGFFGTDAFEMSMSLKANSAASAGEVANIHMSFQAAVDQSGNFVVTLFLNDGSRVKVASQGIDVRDGNIHDITVRFDGAAGFGDIVIDGQVVASENVSGSLGGEARSLMFGNPWGNQKFEGELSAFNLSAESFDFPIYSGEAMPVSDTETTTISPEPVETEDETTLEDEPVVDSDETDTTEEGTISPDPVEAEDDTAPEDDPVVDTGETEAPEEEPTETEDTSSVPESDPYEAEPDEDPALEEPKEELAPEEESSLPEPLLNAGYRLDFASVATSDAVKLHDDAHLAETADGLALSFDGQKDYASLGRLTEFETSQKIAFSVDFISESGGGGAERLVWNHEKVGLTLEGDGLRIHVQNNDGKFHQGFQIEGLGLDDGNRHSATVMVDAESDRLQVVVNDVLVLDDQDTDFDFVGAGGHEWGWSLGTAWNRWFEGEVHDFQVSNDFEFLDITTDDGMPLA